MKKLNLTPVAAAPPVKTDSCCGTGGNGATTASGAALPPGRTSILSAA